MSLGSSTPETPHFVEDRRFHLVSDRANARRSSDDLAMASFVPIAPDFAEVKKSMTLMFEEKDYVANVPVRFHVSISDRNEG